MGHRDHRLVEPADVQAELQLRHHEALCRVDSGETRHQQQDINVRQLRQCNLHRVLRHSRRKNGQHHGLPTQHIHAAEAHE